MSSKSTPLILWPLELSATRRDGAPFSKAGSSACVSAKWPRWLVANCASQPCAVRVSGQAMMAALLIRMCSGAPFQSCAKRCTLVRSARSSRATRTFGLPLSARSNSAAASPWARLRTASVISAPARANAREVSRPRPDAPPVTMARLPVRLMPCTTSSAVLRALKREVMAAFMSDSG